MADRKSAASKKPRPPLKRLGDLISNGVIMGLIRALQVVPYQRRVPLMGIVARRILGPISGFTGRARANLAMVYPEMPAAQVAQIAHDVLDGFGRTLIEQYSPEFRDHIATHTLEGPGLEAALEAKRNGRSIIFCSGHWSNHEATRTALDQAGFEIGALYKPMKNPRFNVHYEKQLRAVSGPTFPIGRRGTKEFVDYLNNSGHVFLLHDVHFARGESLDFLGHPAMTALTSGSLALKTDALLIPYFNTRQPDGLTFKLELMAPIAHSDPKTMVRELMDLLESKIAQDPAQWLWVHRRWKSD